MTNTGDFRRYSYGSDAAYAVQAFNYHLLLFFSPAFFNSIRLML